MATTDQDEAQLEALLSGLLSTPQPGDAVSGEQFTVVVKAGLHRAVTGGRPSVDSLGCAEVLHGAASDRDLARATLKARMEALERYASVSCVDERSTVTTAGELGPAALPLHLLPRHGSQEAGPRSGTHGVLGMQDEVRWAQATRWSDRATVFVPAVMAFNTTPRHPGEQFWVPVSTGTAAHVSRARARENAVLEVVERDAVALNWLLRTSGRRISRAGDGIITSDTDTLRAPHPTSVGETALTSWDITSDLGIPTVLSVLRGPGRILRHVVGAASRRTLCDAAVASAAEAAQIYSGLDSAVRSGDRAPRTPGRCRRIHDGALFMASAARAHCFGYLHGEEPDDAREQSGGPLSHSGDPVGRLIEAGHEIYFVDLTPRDVARAGVHVIRAIVPTLQPLSPVHAARYLASTRLHRSGVPVAEMNPMPCPLA
ncbi:YcaO-like family protein [Streptomyces sp. NPDC060035]|uniref:YcaO-like family protein n=1 Tax=Streptomyces sp. NPDC060035 TaxID=3347044 RepID=UPI003684E319